MDNVKVSVICPAYDAQGYIEKNLTSVLNQTLKEIEIIVIYTPSNDNTEKTVREFSKNYPKIKCIYNDGLKSISSIRNQGLQIAKGEYIAFIDADDFVDSDYLKKLYTKAKSSGFDIVFSSRVDIASSQVNLYQVWEFEQDKLSIDDGNRESVLRGVYRNKLVVWGRIIKREFIEKNDILFFNDLYGGEDLSFSLLSFIYAKNIAYVNDIYYHHVSERKESLSSNLELMVENTLKGLKKLKDLLSARSIKQNLIISAVNITAADILLGYYNAWNTGLFSRLPISSIKKLLPFIKKNAVSLFQFDKLSEINKSKIFKIKYKIFMFAVNNNFYYIPKSIRVIRNLLKMLYIKRKNK
ncbi:MAG: glycosyltransferase [Elusimicrobiota bacterium]|nr:glycosyltransferase [Elusimicrobiota bacterium]